MSKLWKVLVVLALGVTLDLPGVFALRSPLGVVRSGYEYLWLPAIVASCAGLSWGVPRGQGREIVQGWIHYGPLGEPALSIAALGTFAAMMCLLKLRASMIEANRRLEQG